MAVPREHLGTLVIHGGAVDRIIGETARIDDWVFIPCFGDLEGTSFAPSHPLAEVLDPAACPSVLRVALHQGYDAAWVRARFPVVFGCVPGPAEAEKALLAERLVAVRGREAFVFECGDYYGRTALCFAEVVESGARDAIARAFWSLLLREPDALADFSTRVFHPGAGVWLDYECKDGELGLTESEGDA
jgi:hypothetical protein